MGIGAQVMTKEESTYGTAVTVDLAHPFLSEEVEPEHKRVEGKGQRANQLVHRTAQSEPYLIGASGPLTFEATTKDLGWWLKWGMGSLSTGSVSDSVYPHTCVLGTSLASFTFQSNREFYPSYTDQAFTYEGCKVAKLKLECGKEGILTVTVDIVAENYTTGTALATASYTAGAELLSFIKGSLTIAATATPVESWSIEIDNNLDTERIKQRTSATGGPLRQEPVRKGHATVSWSASVDYDALTNFNRFAGTTNSAIHAALVFTCEGPTLAGVSAYPNLVVTLPAARVDQAKGTGSMGSEGGKLLELSGIATDNGSAAPITAVYTNTQATF